MEKRKDFSNMSLDALSRIVSMRPGKEYTKEELRAARTAFMAALYGSPEDFSAEPPCPPSSAEKGEVPPYEPIGVETETPVFAEDVPVYAEDTACVSDTNRKPSVLNTESRLARFLYVFYAFLCVPLLAIESLILFAGSVTTAVLVRDIPFLFIPIACAFLYTILVSVAWHQFLYRTRFGLFLNRVVTLVCFLRGVCLVSEHHSLLFGIVFVSISVLFLLFFFGYDFILESPRRRRGQ